MNTTTRPSAARSWMLALAFGAVLALGGAASVFAASPSADPSASPTTESSDDGSTRGDHLCDRAQDDANRSDDASS